MHGLGLQSLRMDGMLVAGALLAGIAVVVFLSAHPMYRLLRWRSALLWLLLLGATACTALALNNLLWDRIYKGRYYTGVGSLLMLLYPAIWLSGLRFFREDRAARSVWRAVAAVATSLSILIVTWVLCETLL